MKCDIRRAVTEDAPRISRIVIAALRRSNSADYPPELIAKVERSFAPEAVRELMAKRSVFVASHDGEVAGTASLEGNVVRSVFVDPDCQGLSIGRLLMEAVHVFAMEAGLGVLRVPSSITAQGFYEALGYGAVREVFHESERTIVMEMHLKDAQR